MNLPFRGFADLVRDMSAAITASSGRLIDMSVGSVLRAIMEANAAIVLWVQWLILLTLQSTRASTSIGDDLDSWMADFGVSRLQPTFAAGTATLSRYSGMSVSYVPAGTIAKTQDGLIGFTVIADLSNSVWQPTLGSYSMAIGVTTIDVPIVALIPGPSGNVLPNTITILASSIPGVDFVCNTSGTQGGEPAEFWMKQAY